MDPDSNIPATDRLATDLRGFGPIGIATVLVILAGNLVVVPLSGVLVLVWAWRSKTPWKDVGLVRPQNWVRTLLIALASGVAFKLAMKALVMPLLGAPPTNQAYQFLVGDPGQLLFIIYAVVFGAGFGEEMVFRGFLFERLGKLFGSTVAARIAIVVLTSAFFGIVHIHDQGLAGVEQATIVGLVFGSVYVKTQRLIPIMIAHAAFDLTAVGIIYWNVESWVAHWIFR